MIEGLIFHLDLFVLDQKQMHRKTLEIISKYMKAEGAALGGNSSVRILLQCEHQNHFFFLFLIYVTSAYSILVHSCDLALIYHLVNICIVIPKVFYHT